MSHITDNTAEKRIKRVDDAIALKEPDRVPFAPKHNMLFAQAAGVNMHDAMFDVRNTIPGAISFLTKYELDFFWSPTFYPIPVLETLGTSYLRWPGYANGIGLDKLFQVLDSQFMEEDEYDEFILDPTHFLMTKVWPRRHKKLQGLSKISFNNVVEFGHYASMRSFADPEVRSALLTLMQAGEQVEKWQNNSMAFNEAAMSTQTPLGVFFGLIPPYDMFADNIRGFINVPMDIMEMPEKVLAAVDIMTAQALATVPFMKSIGVKFAFIPMHGGTDDFMSDATYRKFYWPSLRRVVDELIKYDIVPYMFCEGKYNTRLEVLSELPKGKCILMFEQVDMVNVKKILGNTSCITGNMPSATLLYGTKQQVIDETKRLIDICAPGGGFIMDCSIPLENYNEENFEAFYQTTLEFGKYK